MTTNTHIIYQYCERLSTDVWAEPFNAVTNLAFILAAVMLIPPLVRSRASMIRTADIVLLVGLLFAIAIGSLLWHTLATAWAELADVIPILLFILLYLLSFLYRIAKLNTPQVLGWFGLFLVVNSGLTIFIPANSLNGSIFYLPAFIALILIGLYARHIQHTAAHRWLLSGAIFGLSIVLRSLDKIVCPSWPTGSHFLWHILNAYVLYSVTLALMNSLQPIEDNG